MTMPKITLNIGNVLPFLNGVKPSSLQEEISRINKRMEQGKVSGSDFLGWRHLPSQMSGEILKDINRTAKHIKEQSDVFICIGIGGSYLGAKAAIEFVNHSFFNQLPGKKKKTLAIYFAGQNISSDYIADLIDIIKDKRICLNVISKSGTTTEPAIAFRLLKEVLEKRHGKKEARKRIIVTTDQKKGALKKLADKEGYTTFVIPDDVGGRFSVLTPVGLLPIAVSGINVADLIKGAKAYEKIASNPNIEYNPAYLYAATRNLLYRKRKTTEMLSSFHPSMRCFAEWWKQLAGESEGKKHKGIFPAAVDFTTDLHSMGQWIQEGKRNIFETFLIIQRSNRSLKIPHLKNDDDGLNYISGRTLEYVNDKAYKGTALAHKEGGVPNMTITVPDRSPNSLGQLFYFFECAIAVSGYLLKVNPFNQPGVEFYKKNMFKLLKKPVS